MNHNKLEAQARAYALLEFCARTNPGLRMSSKLVLLGMLRYADNKTGLCWPGTRKLAKNLGVSQTTVMGALRQLRESALAVRGKQTKSGAYEYYVAPGVLDSYSGLAGPADIGPLHPNVARHAEQRRPLEEMAWGE